MVDRVTIKIPKDLYDNLQKKIGGTGFSSVSEFIIFTMRVIASSGSISEESRLTDAELEAVRERLRKLGYL